MIQSLWLRLSVPCVIQLLCCLLLCHQAGIDQAITGARAPNCTIRVFCGQLPVEVSASDDNLLRGLIIRSSSAVPIAARSEKEVRCQKLVFTCARSALLLAHCATILCVCYHFGVLASSDHNPKTLKWQLCRNGPPHRKHLHDKGLIHIE